MGGSNIKVAVIKDDAKPLTMFNDFIRPQKTHFFSLANCLLNIFRKNSVLIKIN